MAGKLPPTDRPAEPSAEPAPAAPSNPEPAGAPRRSPEWLRDLLLARPNRARALAFAGPIVAAVATLWLVIPTLAPGVAAWDTAEFQTVAPLLGTGHPTGYPAYVILGFIATHLLPFGDAAHRMNLLQAILAATTVAATTALVQYLTGRRLLALATGVALLVMPAWSPLAAHFPVSQFNASPLFWRMSTHADYHMFHVALVSLLFLLLVVWERRRTSDDPDLRRHADRWLVAAAFVYAVAFANHGLSYLLPPAIALFVLAVAPRILREGRLIATCAGVLVGTIVVLFAELPIRAAMHAPIVYGHPDSLQGFLYVVMGQQFGGSLVEPFGQLGAKLDTTVALMGSWLGPLGIVALVGIGTSLVRRPRFVLLAVLSAAVTAGFAASYVNADIERYFLVPLYVGYVFVGLGLADMVDLAVWIVGLIREGSAYDPDAAVTESTAAPAPNRGMYSWTAVATLLAEVVLATAVVTAGLTVAPSRQAQAGANPGAVGQSTDNYREIWMRAMLAPADDGGLPENSVIVCWWSDSTTLWYGQKVEGLRPDILIVDDSDRVDNGKTVMQVWDVVDKYLGTRPVFLDRLSGGSDGMDALNTMYAISQYQLPEGVSIARVDSKKGQQ